MIEPVRRLLELMLRLLLPSSGRHRAAIPHVTGPTPVVADASTPQMVLLSSGAEDVATLVRPYVLTPEERRSRQRRRRTLWLAVHGLDLGAYEAKAAAAW
ncbi:hypothetical protein [Streptomyces palmae]|uniref:Uncharacterized protein n=1 Tax=Streptomyces palmae TaxID=1701085 RepID=A0A4Z0HF36_9ACTN|nr:hypothetical protein [Streptomyces palmae]TGB14977.1 hypothetical protein E4099_07440 [Streptomyces palmae]